MYVHANERAVSTRSLTQPVLDPSPLVHFSADVDLHGYKTQQSTDNSTISFIRFCCWTVVFIYFLYQMLKISKLNGNEHFVVRRVKCKRWELWSVHIKHELLSTTIYNAQLVHGILTECLCTVVDSTVITDTVGFYSLFNVSKYDIE